MLPSDTAPTSPPPRDYADLVEDETPTMRVPGMRALVAQPIQIPRPSPIPREFRPRSGMRRTAACPLQIQKRDIEKQLESATAFKRSALMRELDRVNADIERQAKKRGAK